MRPSHRIALLALLLSDVAHSQSFANIGPGQQEARVSIGVTMPFGGAPAHRDAQRHDGPRLELMLTRDYVGATGERWSTRSLRHHPNQVRLGVTLDDGHRLMLNGRALPPADQRLGLSTGAAIGIGVAVVLVAGVIAVAADPPLNDLFEPRN